MSEESAKAFLVKAQGDKEFMAKLQGGGSEETFFSIVKAAGFDFTKEELIKVESELKGNALSETDLKGVAGGTADTSDPAFCGGGAYTQALCGADHTTFSGCPPTHCGMMTAENDGC